MGTLTPLSTATTATTASALLMLSPRLTPIPMSSTTVSATTAMATVTPLPTAATTTTASAPLRLSPRLMPIPTWSTAASTATAMVSATPTPTAMPAGDTAVSTATTDKQRRRTSFAQPDEGTQQYSVFKCDEQTATSQKKYRRALRRSTKLPVAAVMSVIKKQNTE